MTGLESNNMTNTSFFNVQGARFGVFTVCGGIKDVDVAGFGTTKEAK